MLLWVTLETHLLFPVFTATCQLQRLTRCRTQTMRSKFAHLNNAPRRTLILSQPLWCVCCEKMTPDSVRLNPRLSESSKKEWGGKKKKETKTNITTAVISPCKELNHNTGSKWCISHSGMFNLAPSEKIACHSLELELVLRAVYLLLYRVNVLCHTNQYLHSCISKWGKQNKISSSK